MYFVYFIKSLSDPNQTYTGYTTNIEERLQRHNQGQSLHTKRYVPWEIVAYVAVDTKKKALDFEKYIKRGSGYAFAKKRLW